MMRVRSMSSIVSAALRILSRGSLDLGTAGSRSGGSAEHLSAVSARGEGRRWVHHAPVRSGKRANSHGGRGGALGNQERAGQRGGRGPGRTGAGGAGGGAGGGVGSPPPGGAGGGKTAPEDPPPGGEPPKSP